jgi:hypothetical protein
MGFLRRHGLALALLLAAWAWYAGPLLSPRSTLFLTDTFSQDVPLRVHAARVVREGFFPDWTSLVHCGWPIFADSQTGVFYPFFLLYVIAPAPETHDVFMALHFLLAAVFMYLFLAGRGVVPLAAVCGAATFMGGSYFQSTHIVPGVLAAGCWLPLALWLIDRAGAGERRSLWLLSLVNAVVILAGHMHVALISFSVQALYMLARLGLRRAPRLAGALALAFLLPAAIASVQIVPTFWYNLQSTRMAGASSALNWETFSLFPLRPAHLWMFLFPDSFGPPWRYRFPGEPFEMWEEAMVVFQGFAAILLIPLGIALGRPQREALLWTGLLALALAFATAGPLYWLAYHLPVYNWFRWPTRYMLAASLACAALTAMGAAAAAESLQARLRVPTRATLALLAVLTPIGLHRTMGAFTTGADFYRIHAPILLEEKRRSEHFRLLPIARALYGCWNADEAQLRRNALFLPVSYNMLFDAAAAPLFDQGHAVTPRAMHEILSLRSGNALRAAAVTHLSGPVPPDEIPGLEWEIYAVPIPDPEELEVLARAPCYVARLRHARPRAWMVHRTERIDGREDRLARIDAPDFDPAEAAIVEEDVPAFQPPRAPPAVRFQAPAPGEVVVDVETDSDGLLVVADAFHPDVRATLDGVSVPLLRVNHAFRGVVVPRGRHQVQMRYRVAALREGLFVSALGLILVVWGIRRAGRGRAPGEPGPDVR